MELHLKFYRVPRNRRGRRPCKFPGYSDQLWATPPGQPKILLFFPGPGRVVLPSRDPNYAVATRHRI